MNRVPTAPSCVGIGDLCYHLTPVEYLGHRSAGSGPGAVLGRKFNESNEQYVGAQRQTGRGESSLVVSVRFEGVIHGVCITGMTFARHPLRHAKAIVRNSFLDFLHPGRISVSE